MNLLLTGAWAGAKENIEKLEGMGHKVKFLQMEKHELPVAYDWVEGVICNGLFLTHKIENFKNLKYIQLTSAGFDRVPMGYVKDKNIEIHNARGVYSIPMAEFALAGVLSLYKKLSFFKANQDNKVWEKNRNLTELFGKKVCIIGCGSVGNECAKRFDAFGCAVIGVNRTIKDNELYKKIYSIDDIDEALKISDIVVLTLPLTDETHYLMNKERLSRMKKGSIFVNIARGAIVDTHALIECLNDNISGAVLDVFEEEPLNESSPLWNMENVILTPHNSFVSDRNIDRLNEVVLKNIENKEVKA